MAECDHTEAALSAMMFSVTVCIGAASLLLSAKPSERFYVRPPASVCMYVGRSNNQSSSKRNLSCFERYIL